MSRPNGTRQLPRAMLPPTNHSARQRVCSLWRASHGLPAVRSEDGKSVTPAGGALPNNPLEYTNANLAFSVIMGPYTVESLAETREGPVGRASAGARRAVRPPQRTRAFVSRHERTCGRARARRGPSPIAQSGY